MQTFVFEGHVIASGAVVVVYPVEEDVPCPGFTVDLLGGHSLYFSGTNAVLKRNLFLYVWKNSLSLTQ